MAFYLLAGELEKIMENIGRLADLGYREIPTLYEEAMLIYLIGYIYKMFPYNNTMGD